MSGQNRARLAWLFATFVGLVSLVSLTAAQTQAAVRPPQAPEGALANAFDDILNHFWCYRTQGTAVDENVELQDQFDAAPIGVTVGAPFRFCNPSKKVHSGVVTKIPFPNDHLLWYKIGAARTPPTRKIKINNQFGRGRLNVYEPAVALAVPTQKDTLPPPKDTDHFKCYRVDGQTLNVSVNLRDQFQRGPNLVVARAVFLCNPTLKNHAGSITPPLHPEAHLVCYTITVKPLSKQIQTINQFRAEDLTVRDPDVLCVPSKKKIITN